MKRDIDYAATAVKTAIVEKFGRRADLNNLEVSANDQNIVVRDGPLEAEGTRDNLLAALRSVDSYDSLWDTLRGK